MSKLIGVIGGTGLDNPAFFTAEKELAPRTPYGRPSSPLRVGRLRGSDERGDPRIPGTGRKDLSFGDGMGKGAAVFCDGAG